MRAIRDQRGQTATEYMGILLVVAAIAGALLTSGLAGQIADGMREAICRITGGVGCGDVQQADSNAPKGPCVLAAANQKVSINGSFNVRLAKVKLEGGVEYQRQKRSDGTVAITLKLGTGGGVGPALAKKLGPLSLDGSLKGAQEGGVTFLLSGDDEANRFAGQLKESTKALAAGPLVSRVMGWDVDIDVPPVESAYYQTGPGATLSAGADNGLAYGKGSIDVQHALGVRRDFTTGTPTSGDTTIYYNVAGKGSGEAGAMIGETAGLNLDGSWQIAVTLDSRGDPKKLSLLGAGGAEGMEGLAGKQKNLQTVMKNLEAVDFGSTSASGKRIEVQADLDLTDPKLRATALSFLQGRNPQTAKPVSRRAAAGDLWDAMVESSTVNYRTYDTQSSKTGGTVEPPIGPGGGGTYESKGQELTSAHYLEPGQGFVPWEACKKPS
ncbi:MAG: hypothetical protein AVDCRST_MAG30-693 [uncultured Solirubrobacteraceae bacterium]|uniref:Uncharacterized protein n=1 Tax=uncultured Solirubrobacteraceae bacterium TaxID=1162706 RepID=A0A6J4RZJ5_9ACTN|nr:MAG: hypothetical protein AVDCRST_MAG30-693 [uncultured Solirubrobacteraceae bacterium]